jgi:RNA polymerase sigma-70 factor (ECF subfamily)
MELPSDQKERIEKLIGCLGQGDDLVREKAVNELIRFAGEYLREPTHWKLVRRPDIRRWEDTDDLVNNAMARLARALPAVKLESAEHFLSLARLEINRESTDMARKHYGPEGLGRNHHTDAPSLNSDAVPLYEAAQDTHDPAKLADWTEFQKQIEKLPEKEREVFKLWFHGKKSLKDIGDSLGTCTETAERRWRSACKLLRKAREDQAPGS